jgi:hypothetical protein
MYSGRSRERAVVGGNGAEVKTPGPPELPEHRLPVAPPTPESGNGDSWRPVSIESTDCLDGVASPGERPVVGHMGPLPLSRSSPGASLPALPSASAPSAPTPVVGAPLLPALPARTATPAVAASRVPPGGPDASQLPLRTRNQPDFPVVAAAQPASPGRGTGTNIDARDAATYPVARRPEVRRPAPLQGSRLHPT